MKVDGFPHQVACLCREVGKPLAEADSEVFRGLDSIHAACSIGPEMAGMYLGSDPTIVQTFYEPVVGSLPGDAMEKHRIDLVDRASVPQSPRSATRS